MLTVVIDAELLVEGILKRLQVRILLLNNFYLLFKCLLL